MKEDLALRGLLALKDGGKAATTDSLKALKSEIIAARDEWAAKSVDLAAALASQPKTQTQRGNLQAEFEEARNLEDGFDRLAGQISAVLQAREYAA